MEIQKIEMFKTIDGKLFEDYNKANLHNKKLIPIYEVVVLLGGVDNEIDDSCEFANGGGYYTIPMDDYNKANILIESLLKKYNIPYNINSRVCYEHPYLGIISNITIKMNNNKRYGQSYYANHPLECKDIEWNKNLN
jgi:hypothetical protein